MDSIGNMIPSLILASTLSDRLDDTTPPLGGVSH